MRTYNLGGYELGGVKRMQKEYKRVDPLNIISLKLFIEMVLSSPEDHNVPFCIPSKRNQFILEQIVSFVIFKFWGKVVDIVTCSKGLSFMKFMAGYLGERGLDLLSLQSARKSCHHVFVVLVLF